MARQLPKKVISLLGHTGPEKSLAVSEDGKWLFSGSDDKTIKVWDLETGREIRALSGHSNDVTSLVVSKDGMRLFSGSADNTIKIWSLETVH